MALRPWVCRGAHTWLNSKSPWASFAPVGGRCGEDARRSSPLGIVEHIFETGKHCILRLRVIFVMELQGSCEKHSFSRRLRCLECGHLMTPLEAERVCSDEGKVPNRAWFELYWIGPRELHAQCDPWGTVLRGVASPCPVGDCEDQSDAEV